MIINVIGLNPTFTTLSLTDGVATTLFNVNDTATRHSLDVHPKGATGGFFRFHDALSQGGVADFNLSCSTIYSLTGLDTIQGANYYNAIDRYGATTDGTFANSVHAFEFGSEGNYTTIGGFTQKRLYLWQFDDTGGNGKTVFLIDKSRPDVFVFGSTVTGRIDVLLDFGTLSCTGISIGNTDADATVSSSLFNSTIAKTNSNTRAFPVVKIKPTINTPGSSNTTVNCLDIDTTNTDVTGTTTNLIKGAYGGTQKILVDSTGAITAAAYTAGSVLFAGTAGLFSQDNSNLYYDSSGHKLWLGNPGQPSGWPVASSKLAIYAATTVSGTVGADGGNANFNFYSYSGASQIVLVSAGGSMAIPVATASGATLGSILVGGYTTTVAASGFLKFVASETWSSGHAGTKILFAAAAIGATANTQRLQIDEAGLTTANHTGLLLSTTTTWTNGAAAQVATLTNGPAAGNPTKWIPVNDNGTTRYIPAW